MSIDWDVSDEDKRLIKLIAERSCALYTKLTGNQSDIVEEMMNFTACHANGTPLRLQALLDADDFAFAHDAFGIGRHINKRTGKMDNCFLPRFAQ